jgi:outer membrane cobalamin receptor
MKLWVLFLLLLSFAVAMGNGAGEEKVYQLPDTINVTAERFATPINNIPWPARTISISQTTPKATLSETLDGVAGADLAGYGGMGQLSNIMLWGAPSSQILLLYDGRPVYNFATGGFNLSDYNVEELSRIELVKGTQSSLYGSEAIGGVINLIPKFEYLDKVGAGIDYGNFGYMGYNLSIARKVQNWHFNSQFEQNRTDNDRPNSGVRRDRVSFRSLYLPQKKNIELSLGYRYFQDTLGLPGAIPNPEAIPYYGNSESNSLVNYQKDFNHSFDARLKINPDPESPLSAQFDMYYEKKRLEYFGRYAYLGFADSVDVIDRNTNIGRNSGLTGRLRWEKERFSLSGGLEFLSGSSRIETINSSSSTVFVPDSTTVTTSTGFRLHHRDTYAAWAGSGYDILPILRIDLTGRLELVNGEKLYNSINAGLKLAPVSTLSIKLAYGRAYRLPAFNDLYWPTDQYSEGNPNLIPEKGENLLLSMNGKPGESISINADIFYRNVRNLISWAPVGRINDFGSPRWTPSNLNRFHSAGIDLGLKLLFGKKFQIEGDLTYQRARQENMELVYSGADGRQLFEKAERAAAFVPDLKGRLGFSGELGKSRFDLSLVYTSKKSAYYAVYAFDSFYNSLISYAGKYAPANLLANLGVSHSIAGNISISLNVNDIFDTRPIRQFGALDDRDYPSSGRNIKIGINFNWD